MATPRAQHDVGALRAFHFVDPAPYWRMVAAFVFAAFFYAAAEYERLTGWKWALASIVISLIVLQLFDFLAFVIPFQIALFGVMWWRNIKHRDEMDEERTARAERDRRTRQEHIGRARDQADRNDRK